MIALTIIVALMLFVWIALGFICLAIIAYQCYCILRFCKKHPNSERYIDKLPSGTNKELS